MTAAHAPAPAETSYRLFGTYRFLLAIGVVVSHSFLLTPDPDSLAANIGIGNISVMSFFVLSGFIISEAGNTFYRGRPFAFLLNRFWRIAPPYWLAVAISIAVHYALFKFGTLKFPDYPTPPSGVFDPRNIVSNFFVIFPFQGRTGLVHAEGFYGFVRFYWAILVEVEFYLVAFATFCAMAMAPHLRRKIAYGAVTGFLVLHFVNEYAFPIRPELALAIYFLLGVCLYGYCAGSRAAGWAAVVSFVATILHFVRYAQGKVSLESALEGLAKPTIWLPTLLLAAMPFVIIALSRARPGEPARRIDRQLGDLSYPIYLNHFVVIVCYASLGLEPSWGAMFWSIAGSIALSWLAAAAIESPLRPLRNRIRGQAL